MATQYTQNPDFYNYSRLGETRNLDRENPPFAWPGVNVKNINGPLGVDSVKMARGFMRSILTDPDIISGFADTTQNRQVVIDPSTKNRGHYRLNFQFNPEYIERSVSQTPGAVNPILQSVSNLTQPIPGSATFNFTMTFNREMEVNAAGNRADSQTLWNGDNLEDFSGSLRDPGLVGVWADLYMFDLIVGQGITPELLDLVSAFTEVQAAERSVNESTTTDEEPPAEDEKKDEDTAQTDTDATSFNKEEFETNFTKNFGNSAFLNPLPVRIVFSDTFMVEGMVTGTSVAFQKFNHRMIPTICQVNVNFTAMYLGFAKKKAFLTDNLTAWAKDQAKANQDQQLEDQSKVEALANSVTGLKFYPNCELTVNNSYGTIISSEKNRTSVDTNNDYFLAHSFANATVPNNTQFYSKTTTTLERWYNIWYTYLYKNGVDITNAARLIYDRRALPIVFSVLYNQLNTNQTKPNYTFKIELVYKSLNPDTGKKDKEHVVGCTFSKLKETHEKAYTTGSTAVITPMVYKVSGTLDLAKFSNIPKINSKLIGTENIPFNTNADLGLRITIVPSFTNSDNAVISSSSLAPVQINGIQWSSAIGQVGLTVYEANVSLSNTNNKPRDIRPPDRLD